MQNVTLTDVFHSWYPLISKNIAKYINKNNRKLFYYTVLPYVKLFVKHFDVSSKARVFFFDTLPYPPEMHKLIRIKYYI